MKTVLVILSIALCSICIAQTDDSLRVQEIDEVAITTKSKKEIAYKNSRYYIMDFHIDSNGTFVLLNRFREYYVYALNEDMKPTQKMLVPFHPKRLFSDCVGGLHILSKDSMYEVKHQEGLEIGERHPIERYDYYFKDCVASTDEAKIFKDVRNYKQTTEFYQIGIYDFITKDIYTIEDSTVLRSMKETQQEILKEEERLRRKYSRSKMNQAPTWEDQTLAGQPRRDRHLEIQNHLDRRQFYQDFIIRPHFNGLFVLNDTIFVFDHVNGYMVRLNMNTDILEKQEIAYHNAKKWKGEMHMDETQEKFYSVEQIHGAQVLGLISKNSRNVIKRTKITKHAYPEKVIVYNGYAYYVYRQNFDDNLNKLFRQKL